MTNVNRIGFALLLSPIVTYALEQQPWFGEVLEFHAIPQYEYNFFDEIDRGCPQLKKTFNTHLFRFDLDVTVPETWNFEAELEFADTTTVDWGYRSFALQVRRLWLDDVAGDPVSLTTGLVYRDSSKRMRRAFSTPYHAQANFEFHTAFGKEWSCGPCWFLRSFALAAFGQGTHGAPWFRGDFFLLGNVADCHTFRLYMQSYIGFGSKETARTDRFHGWANIAHKSIDLGASYGIRLGCYGQMRFDYLRRVFARSYPEEVNLFQFTYDFPFSLF